ncbi:hypothetical protein BH10PSE1_BH10PSE1_24580 [soil metagenome]
MDDGSDGTRNHRAAMHRVRPKSRLYYPNANAVPPRKVAEIAAAPQRPVDELAYRFITIAQSPSPPCR